MPAYKANDLYRATLRSTWIASPADTTLSVTAIPDNTPTIVVVGWKGDYETKFAVTGTSGDSPSNYTLTGVTVISGGTQNIAEQTTVNCLNSEEFFNQYEEIFGRFTNMVDTTGLDMAQIDTPSSPDTGRNKLYPKSDGKLYFLDEDDNEYQVFTENAVALPRTTTETSSATPTINTDNTDIHTITALATAITSMTTNLSGTPVNGQKLIVRIKDNGTARAITWGASFASRGATLPTTTVLGKYHYVGLIWNSTTSTWDAVAAVTEA